MKPSWLNISPDSGSGNGTFIASADEHTGRIARAGHVQVTAVGVPSPVVMEVMQEGRGQTVSFSDGTEMAAPKTAGNVAVKGKSNSQLLTFAFVGDSKDVELPVQFTAAGIQTDNGSEIEGDPGSYNEYEFSIVLNFPLNDTVDEIERTLKVSTEDGTSAQIVIKQAAGDARLTVNPEVITLQNDGTPVTVNVESNTSWTVS